VSLYVYRCPECPTWAPRVSLCEGAHHTHHQPMRCMAHPSPVAMVLVEDSASVLLPMDPRDTAPSLVPLKVEHLHRAGILLPETQDALEWLYRHRARNGYAEVFSKVQGRVCMDLVAFARISRAKAGK